MEAESVARALYNGWIARFGCPKFITTDRGVQFRWYLIQLLVRLTATTQIKTTSYNAEANGMVDRHDRQLKAAIRSHQNNNTGPTC